MSQRLNKDRYAVAPPWEQVSHAQNDREGDAPFEVFHHEAGLREKRSGHVWGGGAHRVRITGPAGHPKSTTFYGETAWSDAERYVRDAIHWYQRRGL